MTEAVEMLIEDEVAYAATLTQFSATCINCNRRVVVTTPYCAPEFIFVPRVICTKCKRWTQVSYPITKKDSDQLADGGDWDANPGGPVIVMDDQVDVIRFKVSET